MEARETGRRRRRPVPVWLVVVAGAILTCVGLLWSSTLYDERGEAVLDGPTATVLVALLGVVGTALTVVLQRQKQVVHELRPNSGSTTRDAVDRTESLAREALETAQRAEAAAKKSADDTVQLREDVQALRVDHTGTASDIRGIRRDIGRLTDALINNKEKES